MPSPANPSSYSHPLDADLGHVIIADGTLLASDTVRGNNATTNSNNNNNNNRKEKKTKRQYNIRNKNRPKRPLSAYNLFFRHERKRLVEESLTEQGVDGVKSRGKTRTGKRVHRKTHGAIGFAELGKHISEAWKSMDGKDRAPFQAEADKDKERYQKQLGSMEQQQQPASLSSSSSDQNQNSEGSNKRISAASASASHYPLESHDSFPIRMEKKNKISNSNPSDIHDRNYSENNIDTEDGRTFISQQQGPGYGYQQHPPFASPAQHRPPPTHQHFDYGAYYAANDHHRGAPPQPPPPAFAPPPPPHGPPPGMASVYGAHPTTHYPYPGYQQQQQQQQHHSPNKEDESNHMNPQHHHQQQQQQQPMAVAFSPPYPTPQQNRHDYAPPPPPYHNKGEDMPPPPMPQDTRWAAETATTTDPPITTATEYAFQCEVCNKAVFETFEECAEHEQACCAKAPPPPSNNNNNNQSGKKSAKTEEQRQQAVEAVMLLKKSIEC